MQTSSNIRLLPFLLSCPITPVEPACRQVSPVLSCRPRLLLSGQVVHRWDLLLPAGPDAPFGTGRSCWSLPDGPVTPCGNRLLHTPVDCSASPVAQLLPVIPVAPSDAWNSSESPVDLHSLCVRALNSL
ncbi:hypothetical protein CW304_04280 [Bacillus sp. UFRGS-B20]|nr:hypothetical protein CW304_04280 [Bacillus sp. UFRGS-B20]